MKDIARRIASLCIKYPWAWLIFKYTALPVLAAVDLVRFHLPEFVADYKKQVADIETLIGKASEYSAPKAE